MTRRARSIALALSFALLAAAPASLAQQVMEEETDDEGRVVRTLDEDGREIRYVYDDQGRAKAEIQPRAGSDDLLDEAFTRDGASRDSGTLRR